jgi:hypothetical protein
MTLNGIHGVISQKTVLQPKSRHVNLKFYPGQNLEPKVFIITGSLCFNTCQQIFVIAQCEFDLFHSDCSVLFFTGFE